MPTRDEIVKALRGEQELVCFDPLSGKMCDPVYLTDMNRNSYILYGDAADLIEQQAREIEQLKTDVAKEFICFVGNPHRVKECPYGDRLEELEELESSYQQVKKALHDAGFESLEGLLEDYAQVKHERDAAIADLYKAKSCNTCAKQYEDDCLRKTCWELCSAFVEGEVPYKWRGVKEEP